MDTKNKIGRDRADGKQPVSEAEKEKRTKEESEKRKKAEERL